MVVRGLDVSIDLAARGCGDKGGGGDAFGRHGSPLGGGSSAHTFSKLCFLQYEYLVLAPHVQVCTIDIMYVHSSRFLREDQGAETCVCLSIIEKEAQTDIVDISCSLPGQMSLIPPRRFLSQTGYAPVFTRRAKFKKIFLIVDF